MEVARIRLAVDRSIGYGTVWPCGEAWLARSVGRNLPLGRMSLAAQRMSNAMFDAFEEIAVHPISALYMALARDPNPAKIDLGIGVYRDEQGHSPIMAS